MADKKISALTSLAQGDVAASTDVLPIVDTSATETKKITASALVGAGMTAGVTNVDINSGAIDGTTIGANSAAAGTFTNLTASGTVSFSGATVSNGGAVTTIDINGGTIDATSIGASSASTGAFTTLSASSTVSGTGFSTYLASPPAIGGTTAAAGSFTTLTTSSTVTLNGGTANGVLYLNGSKVATSGSALTFDGTNLAPDGTSRNLGTASLRWGTVYATSLSDGSDQFVGSAGTTVRLGFGSSWTAQAFAISGSEQMRLTSTGLGIGTSSPTQKLHVAGNILSLSAAGTDSYVNVATSGVQNTYVGFNNSGSTNAFGVLNNYSYFGNGNAYGLQFITNGAVAATISTAGNLGLGVTPSAWSGGKALQVKNTSNPVFMSETGGDGYFGYNAYYNGTNWIYVGSYYANALKIADGTFQFLTAPSGTAGNQITGANAFVQTMTLDASGYLTVPARIYTGQINGDGTNDFALLSNNASKGIIFYTGVGGVSAVERARITSGGDFGVGTTSPNIGGVNKAITVNSATSTNCSYELSVNNVLQGSLFTGISTSSVALYTVANGPLLFGTNNTERARITSTGEFCIGNSATDARLLVSKTSDGSEAAPQVRIEGNGYSAFHWLDATAYYIGQNSGSRSLRVYSSAETAGVELTAGGTSWGTFSDERLKYDIEPVTNAIESLANIRTVKYRLKDVDSPESKKKIGVIAQDLVGVIDEVVDSSKRPDDETDYLNVRYSELIPVLVKAIQEQQAMIKSLETKVAALESK